MLQFWFLKRVFRVVKRNHVKDKQKLQIWLHIHYKCIFICSGNQTQLGLAYKPKNVMGKHIISIFLRISSWQNIEWCSTKSISISKSVAVRSIVCFHPTIDETNCAIFDTIVYYIWHTASPTHITLWLSYLTVACATNWS